MVLRRLSDESDAARHEARALAQRLPDDKQQPEPGGKRMKRLIAHLGSELGTRR
jgi:hypothetical protein